MARKNNTGGAVLAVEGTRDQYTVRYSSREEVEHEICSVFRSGSLSQIESPQYHQILRQQ